MNNYEKIASSPESLAQWLSGGRMDCDVCPLGYDCVDMCLTKHIGCYDVILEWLMREDEAMKHSESKPFLGEMEYAVFRDNWCHECVHYKEREDGSPEFPEFGGCPILDAMELAKARLEYFPGEDIIEERDEDGNVLYWHKCTKFEQKKAVKNE